MSLFLRFLLSLSFLPSERRPSALYFFVKFNISHSVLIYRSHFSYLLTPFALHHLLLWLCHVHCKLFKIVHVSFFVFPFLSLLLVVVIVVMMSRASILSCGSVQGSHCNSRAWIHLVGVHWRPCTVKEGAGVPRHQRPQLALSMWGSAGRLIQPTEFAPNPVYFLVDFSVSHMNPLHRE